MTRLFAFLFALIFMSMISVAYAQSSIDTEGLSEAARAELALKAAELRKAAITPKKLLPDAQQIADYANIGEQVGKALASTARELGVEVNKFATTPVGFLAIFLIVWHFFGVMAVHIMFGSMWFIVAGSAWIYFFKRLYMKREVTYHENGKKKMISYAAASDRDGNLMACALFVLAVIVAIGLFAFFSF